MSSNRPPRKRQKRVSRQLDSSLFKRTLDQGIKGPMSEVISFLTCRETAALAQVNLFNSIYVRASRSQRGRQVLEKPMLEDLRSKRLRDAFFADIPITSAEALAEDKQTVNQLFISLASKGITNLERTYVRFKKLGEFVADLTLNEDLLILLSCNEVAIKQWVNDNFYRLHEPVFDCITPIHLLAFNNHCELLREINKKTYLEVYTDGNSTFAHFAALGNSIDILKFCIEIYGKDELIKMVNASQDNLLNVAALCGNSEAMLFCYEKLKMQPTYRTASNAACSGSVAAIRICRDVFKLDLTQLNEDGEGLQHEGALGSLDVLKFFHEELKADMFLKDKIGRTIVFNAAAIGDIQKLNYCKKLGLDLQAIDHAGYGIQHLAAHGGNTALLLFLYQNKFDMKALSKGDVEQGYVAKVGVQHYATSNLDSLLLCVEMFKLNMQALDEDGDGVLAWSIIRRSVDSLYFGYHSLKLNSHHVNSQGLGLQHLAAHKKFVPGLLACQILGVDMCLQNNSGKTILVYTEQSKKYRVKQLTNLIIFYSKFQFPEKYTTAWNSKDNLIDCIEAVLTCYKKSLRGLLNEPCNYYRKQAVEGMIRRVKDFKGKNPIELFYSLNYRILEFLGESNKKLVHRQEITNKDPFVICTQFLIKKVLEHIRKLHLDFKASQEQEAQFRPAVPW